MEDDLSQRWRALAQSLSLRNADSLGAELLARYREPHRDFHRPAHLRQVLDQLDALNADARLKLAAWFHDAVYRPGRPDNERRSAALARQCLAPCALPQADIDFVAAAVLATTGHAAADSAFDPLLDADLAVLGAAPDVYRHYCNAIRREFANFPARLFKAGRSRFLRSMLQRPTIYRSAECQSRFEAQARRNLQDELAQWNGGR